MNFTVYAYCETCHHTHIREGIVYYNAERDDTDINPTDPVHTCENCGSDNISWTLDAPELEDIR